MKTLNDGEMNDSEKTMILRHLRDDEEVYYVVRNVTCMAEEIRTLGQALLDHAPFVGASKAKGKDKFSHAVFTRLREDGQPARLFFLNNGFNAAGPSLHYSTRAHGTDNGGNYISTTQFMSLSTPHSIIFSPRLIYKLIQENEQQRQITQEKMADPKAMKEFRKAEIKARKIEAKEERKHPSAKRLNTWFEVRSLDIDKKLVKGGYVALTTVLENVSRRTSKDFATVEQIKDDMGVSAKGGTAAGKALMPTDSTTMRVSHPTKQRPYELDLFFGEKTEEMYGMFREILGI